MNRTGLGKAVAAVALVTSWAACGHGESGGRPLAAERQTLVAVETASTLLPHSMYDDPRTDGYHGLPPAPAPPGKEPLAFNDDGLTALAGYVVVEGPNGWDDGVPPPVLDIGSGRHEVRGEEVTDFDGALVGYAVDHIGFVDLATARNPEMIDALLADAAAREEARPHMTEAEVCELSEIDEGC